MSTSHRLILSALALLCPVVSCVAQMSRSGGEMRVGPAVVRMPDRDPGRLAVTINRVTFRPLVGLAALGPDGVPDPAIPLRVTLAAEGGALRLTITSDDSRCRGLDPGRVEGLGEWRRLDLSQHALAYGQMWWQKTTYSVRGDFWFTAHWVMEESNGTAWEATELANQGTRPFPAALRVKYAPDTNGAVLPLREVLELRFSRDLWDVVPPVRQQPSEHARELARSVQLDLWVGAADPELVHLLSVLRAAGRGRMRFLTILQNWEAGGWDALLPDSVWLPDYPPNPAIGTVQQLRRLCELGKSMGRFGFRTNYRVLRPNAPSLQRGLAHYATGPDGRPLDYLSPLDWPVVAGRQETEIRDLFAPNASFTDQLTSGAAPWMWHDYAPGGCRSMSATLRHMQGLARLIRSTHSGPLGSETLIDQQLLGEFVDTGDFGVMDGHRRLFAPEYKLRRLHHLSGFHGMGLMYRFYEMPPFPTFHAGKTTFGDDAARLDDYRACEVLFGNGAYVCYPFANWRHWLVECLLIGNLQRHYALQPVRRVLYQHKARWLALADLVRAGIIPNTDPWSGPQTPEFGRVRVEYANGLTVVVNRLPEPLPVPDARPADMVLPQYGWVAWRPDGTLVAFSANWPQTTHRVDYLRDDVAELEFIDPRGAAIRGVSCLTLWEKGQVALTADIAANVLRVGGQSLPLALRARRD